jgi:hypothetical protein
MQNDSRTVRETVLRLTLSEPAHTAGMKLIEPPKQAQHSGRWRVFLDKI